MTTRRRFLASLATATMLPRLTWADVGSPAFLAAAKEADGGYALFGLAQGGADLFRVALPSRGHAAAGHPSAPEAVAFARRPGTFALVIDCARGTVRQRLSAPRGHHFYGHGAFAANGEILCTTENRIDTGEGRIGLWSRAEQYRRIGDIASGGIGPHDIKMLAGSETLVVANGGIRTHPDSGREKLNVATMRPNLAYLSLDGSFVERVELPPDLHRNSIRHLALGPGGLVAFAMQWQGDPLDAPPLVGTHRRGEAPALNSADLAEQIAMQGYAGSIAVDPAGATVTITSPRGGRVHLFDAAGAFRASLRRPDICGIGPSDDGFIATDGLGGVTRVSGSALTPLGQRPRAWDNHLIAV